MTSRATFLGRVVLTFLIGTPAALAQATHTLPRPSPLAIENAVRDKNFYFLHILALAPARESVLSDPNLKRVAAEYRARWFARKNDRISSCSGRFGGRLPTA